MPKRKRQRDPLLLEAVACLGSGRITMGPIHDKYQKVAGFIKHGGRIRINQNIDVCDTALHEALHALHPEWSESYVRARTARLMGQLSNCDVDAIYGIVVKNSRKTKRPYRIT